MSPPVSAVPRPPRKEAASSARASARRWRNVRCTGASHGSGPVSWSNASPTTVAWSAVRRPNTSASPNSGYTNDRLPATRGSGGAEMCSSASAAKWRQPRE